MKIVYPRWVVVAVGVVVVLVLVGRGCRNQSDTIAGIDLLSILAFRVIDVELAVLSAEH